MKRSSVSCCNYGKNFIYIFGGVTSDDDDDKNNFHSVDIIDKLDTLNLQLIQITLKLPAKINNLFCI